MGGGVGEREVFVWRMMLCVVVSQDWEKKYIHSDWSQYVQDNFTIEQVYYMYVHCT